MTSWGWTRANLLYENLRGLPPAGSPLEPLIILVWRMREDANFYQNRAVVQAMAAGEKDGDAVDKAWKKYVDAKFPYYAATLQKSDNAALAVLERERKRGPLVVTPQIPMTVTSKVRSRLAARRKVNG